MQTNKTYPKSLQDQVDQANLSPGVYTPYNKYRNVPAVYQV
jgi:hypothetical protein